jgi:F-type H+-transporting ATPase subunit 8
MPDHSLSIRTMPQALPFTFTSQAVYTLGAAALLVYLLSVYVLPPYVELFVSRVYVTKL